MSFAYLPTGTNLSDFVSVLNGQFDAVRAMERSALASEPSVKVVGQLWDRTDYTTIGESICRWNGTAWTLLMDPDYAQLNAGGTVAAAANLPMGGFKLTGLAAGSANGDSVRYEQAVLKAAPVLAAALDAGAFKLTNLATPTASGDAATKGYVDGLAVPVVGSVRDSRSIGSGTGISVDVALGFVPSRVMLRCVGLAASIGATHHIESPMMLFQGGSVGTPEVVRAKGGWRDMSLPNTTITPEFLGDTFSLTRRSGSPVLGFSFATTGTNWRSAVGGVDYTWIEYMAWQ